MSFSSRLAELVEMNPWWGFLGCIIAIFATLLAIIFYYKSKKVKLPYYAVRSSNIVSNLVSTIASLEMLYSGNPIENLTVTKIAFWNAGRDTIDSGDIAIADPLTVRVKGGYKILDTKILYEKKKANKFSITTSADQSSSSLNFDYVDKDEGVVIQLIHTGKSSEDIEVRGTIKGASKIIRKRGSFRNIRTISFKVPFTGLSYSYSNEKVSYSVAAIMFILPIIAALTIGIASKADIPPIIILFILYWGFGLLLIKRRVPKGFDVFEEEF